MGRNTRLFIGEKKPSFPTNEVFLLKNMAKMKGHSEICNTREKSASALSCSQVKSMAELLSCWRQIMKCFAQLWAGKDRGLSLL